MVAAVNTGMVAAVVGGCTVASSSEWLSVSESLSVAYNRLGEPEQNEDTMC